MLCAQTAHGHMIEKVGLQFLFGHHVFCPGQPRRRRGWELRRQDSVSNSPWTAGVCWAQGQGLGEHRCPRGQHGHGLGGLDSCHIGGVREVTTTPGCRNKDEQ